LLSKIQPLQFISNIEKAPGQILIHYISRSYVAAASIEHITEYGCYNVILFSSKQVLKKMFIFLSEMWYMR